MNNRDCLDRSNFWQHVHKFDMRPMIQAVNSEPYLQQVNIEQVDAVSASIFTITYMLHCISLRFFFNACFPGCNECMSDQTFEYVHRGKARLQTIRFAILPGEWKRCIDWGIFHILRY